MNPLPEGGPAFPCDWKDFQPATGEQIVREQFFGMTLRDYFAAKALSGLLAHSDPSFGTVAVPINPWPWLAKEAYRAADAMLAESHITAAPAAPK